MQEIGSLMQEDDFKCIILNKFAAKSRNFEVRSWGNLGENHLNGGSDVPQEEGNHALLLWFVVALALCTSCACASARNCARALDCARAGCCVGDVFPIVINIVVPCDGLIGIIFKATPHKTHNGNMKPHHDVQGRHPKGQC